MAKSTEFTSAARMARARGVNEKTYRARLCRNLAHHPDRTRGTWRVEIGSDLHRLMTQELAQMEKQLAPPDPK